MIFLCFLGALPEPLVAFRVGSLVLFKVYNMAPNTTKNTREPGDHFVLPFEIY